MEEAEEKVNTLSLIKEFSSPLTSVIFMMLGSGFFQTFITLFLDVNHYSRVEIGYIHSAYYLGMLVGAFRMENFILKIGHIQTLSVFGSLATSSVILQSLMSDFWTWVIFRFVFGLSLAAIYIVIESWLLDRSKLSNRGIVLSLYMMSLYSSQAFSQQFLNHIEINSYVPFLIAAFFTSIGVIPVSLSRTRITLSEVTEKMSFSKILKISPFGVLGCLVSGVIISSVYGFFPLLAVSRGIPGGDLMFITILGGMVLQWPMGKLSDYFERRKTLLGLVILAMSFMGASFFYKGDSQLIVLTICLIIGGFSFTLYPLSITQVCDHLDQSQITTATSLMLVAYGIGSVAGPITSSAVISQFGIDSILLFFTLLLFIVSLIGIYTTIRRPIIPQEEQSAFVPLPRNTPIAYELDPRSEEPSGEEEGVIVEPDESS
ncbi:MAG: MFS transporter [Chlamydiales bacterium]